MQLSKKIIVALDVDTREKAISLITELKEAETFKVGLKLFTSEGPSLVKEILNLEKKIFLDLKLHDIPNIVAETVRVAVRMGVNMLTLHASGGREMMARASEEAALEAEKRNEVKPILLAVTVLTSLKNDNLKEIGFKANTIDQVLRLSQMAYDTHMDGIVCSPHEIEIIKKEFGNNLLVVTPGIRPSWTAQHDQKRVMTPSLALKKGADYLVIGRPIIEASSPEKAFLKIAEELFR